MKRTLLQRGAIIAACAAAFVFAACGDNPEFDARTDTVYSLETPSVTAKAYPGVNVVSWKPVTGAEGYKVTVYEEGLYKGFLTNQSGNFGYDTDLKNGKTYTYYVEALSKSSPSSTVREVVATNSRGEASVKAIVPPLDTKALDLAAYEGGYDGENKKEVGNDKWIVNEGNITVKEVNGKISVSFPMKAYLCYTVNCYNNNLPLDTNANIRIGNDYKSDINANNVMGQVIFDSITAAGTYQIGIVASARGNYVTSKEIVGEETATIEKLELRYPNYYNYNNYSVDPTYLSAEYVLTDNKFVTNADKKVRVAFTPAKKQNGEYAPTTWYKVYRRAEDEYVNTPLTAKVEASTDTTNNTKYYIYDNTVTDVTKVYTYTVVVTDGTKYGSSYAVDLSRETKRDITGLAPSATFDYTTNKVTLSVQVSDIATSVTPAIAKYLVVPTDRITPVFAQEILEEGTVVTLSVVADSDPKKYQTEISTPDFTGDDANVYLVVQATLDGYNTTNVIDSVRIYK